MSIRNRLEKIENCVDSCPACGPIRDGTAKLAPINLTGGEQPATQLPSHCQECGRRLPVFHPITFDGDHEAQDGEG